MLRYILPIVLAFLSLFPSHGLASQTPETVLKQIQQAVDTRDTATFEQYVDLNSLLDQGVTAMITRMRQQTQKGNLGNMPPALAILALSVQNPNMVDSTRSLLKKELGTFVRYGITSGQFTNNPQKDIPPQGLIAPLLGDVSMGAKTLRVAGKPRQSPDMAGARILPVSIHDAGNGRNYPVELRFIPNGNTWKVDSVANMDALLSRFEKEAAE